MNTKLHIFAAAALLAAGTTHFALAGPLDLLFLGAPTAAPGCKTSAPECIGSFAAPFVEPTINGVATTEKCIKNSKGLFDCKPGAGTLISLYDGRFLYFNALEGTENVPLNTLLQGPAATVNDQTRVLSLARNDVPSWAKPGPNDGGANPTGRRPTALVPGGLLVGQTGADGSLFCADVAQLPDGRIMAVGGSDYYVEPGLPNGSFGLIEIEGLKNVRIFDPKDNSWTKAADMHWGRWYPTALALPNSDVFVASGVTKLIKPVYPDKPFQSGRNVVQTETYSVTCGTWTDNGGLAQRSLPLFPRLHLLPNGQVYYNAGGQAYNPLGVGYDQALWNVTAAYNPSSRSWTDLGIAGYPFRLNEMGADQLATALNPTNPQLARTLLKTLTGTTFGGPAQLQKALGQLPGLLADPRAVEKVVAGGIRGSTFSIMLPLRPDANGLYQKAEFLTGGGILTGYVGGSPGLYFATDSSRIDTVDLANGGMRYGSRLTGRLNTARQFASGVLLPDQSVMAFSGSDRDALIAPGVDIATALAERFDAKTETWQPMARARQKRAYHNTATLMPDGRVLVGGHDPAPVAYGPGSTNLESLGFAPGQRDPTFEIYSPPYVFRSDRPTISNSASTPAALDRGTPFTVQTPDAASIDKVQLIRFTDTTHLIDADQRAVEIPIASKSAGAVTIALPQNAAVLPAGYYMLFISKTAADGTIVPSKSIPVHIRPVPVTAAICPRT